MFNLTNFAKMRFVLMMFVFTSLFVLDTLTASADQLSSEFLRPTLIFKITVSNPSTTPRHVIKIGVRSEAYGNFQCVSAASALTSLADYPVRFHVSQPETIIDADPVLAIPPNESAFFTISLYPNATGSCGDWHSNVTALIIFDDGTRLETITAQITADDVAAVRNRDPNRDEVIAALQHRDAGLRLQALKNLNNLSLDSITLETVVRGRLADTNQYVRKEAYMQAGNLRLSRLESDLIGRFEKIPRSASGDGLDNYSSEALALSRALITLKSFTAIDKILEILTDHNFKYATLLQNDLEKLRSPEMPNKLKQLLRQNISWAAEGKEPLGGRGPELAEKYDVLLKLLIDYKDPSSVPLLKTIMSDSKNRRSTRSILSDIVNLTNGSKIVQDPFVRSFHDMAMMFLQDKWGDERKNLRKAAIILAVRTTDDHMQQESLLRSALHDESRYVRLMAAEESALLNLKSLLPDIQESYQTADNLREYFCEAINALDGVCR